MHVLSLSLSSLKRASAVRSREKKSLVETRDTLAAARRDTSSPLSTGHSPSPFPFFPHPLFLIQAVCSGGVVSELRALQQPGLGY